MKRTVHSTRFTFVNAELIDGELVTSLGTIEVPEKNEKKAFKMAVKKMGIFKPVKVEHVSTLYILDDEIFFKYAVKADDTEDDSND